ncbi:MAG: VWA domain-containing protein [bacterium]|nr:VWA domain-containing protein [bacterium]
MFLLFLSLLGSLPLAGRCVTAPSIEADAIEAVADWTKGFRGARAALDRGERKAIERLLIDLRPYRRSAGPARQRALLALLDLASVARDAFEAKDDPRAADGHFLEGRALEEGEKLLDAETARFIAREVLVVEADNSVGRRCAAARLLGTRRDREVLMALSVCARGPGGPVADTAFEMLSGWPDESVHTSFLQHLTRHADGLPPRVAGAIERHFRGMRLEHNDRSTAPLRTWIEPRLISEDWRAAALAISLSRALADAACVPQLIDALEVWGDRVDAGRPVRRVEHDLIQELALRSGRKIGAHPDRWRTWWEARAAGRADPASGSPEGARVTEASFFGLRPVTDRVVFVIDRSGSMDELFRTGSKQEERTRYRESVEQMMGFLEGLGERTHFNVVLFEDGTQRWRNGLVPSSVSQRKTARAWLLRHSPGGGTQLRQGVERAMGLDEEGELDLAQLEADTLIVLCDGKTASGEDWVVPVLRRVNPTARLVIHGVQVGREGDGTLEALARESGGDFIEVDR